MLLQVVFHARMAEEAGLFDFGGVVEAITAKLVRRHPHVFGDAQALNSSEVKALWGRIKADEKRAKARIEPEGRTASRGSRARSAEFPSRCRRFLAPRNCRRELAKSGSTGTMSARSSRSSARKSAEVEAEIAEGSAQTLSGEVGDLLFAAVNLARHLKVDPEAALRGANAKFERRFAHIESRLAEDGRTPEGASLDEMESLWAEAKAGERRRNEACRLRRHRKGAGGRLALAPRVVPHRTRPRPMRRPASDKGVVSMAPPDTLRYTRIPLNNGSGAIPAVGFGTLIPDPRRDQTGDTDRTGSGISTFRLCGTLPQ